jgi:hypothetical protein
MDSPFSGVARWFGGPVSLHLSQAAHSHGRAAPIDPIRLMACPQAGDVLLVVGQTQMSVASKYLTRSTWSHAALFVGATTGQVDGFGQPRAFVGADIRAGAGMVSVAEFAGLHCRVCRPVGLSPAEIDAVIGFVTARLCHQYELKNVLNVAHYHFPTPPVPVRWRRRMLAFGSGDPTSKIRSTLIAQAFHSVRHPIPPTIQTVPSQDPIGPGCIDEILQVRHHRLFVPRDVDVSSYYSVIKPRLILDFDHRRLASHDALAAATA